MSIWTASDFLRTGFSIADTMTAPAAKVSTLATGKANPSSRRYQVTFLQAPTIAETIGRSLASSTYYNNAVWVGNGTDARNRPVALFWTDRIGSRPMVIHPFSLLGNESCSYAESASCGRVVGYGRGEDTEHREIAILWQEMGIAGALSLHPELHLGADAYSRAISMHQDRIVGAGSGSKTDGRDHALLWNAPSANSVADLHPQLLLGAYASSCALAVNAQLIVGFGQGSRTGRRDHALLWTGSTSASAFDIHPDSIVGEAGCSYAHSVSEGCIVGYGRGQRTREFSHALLWKEPVAATAVDLHPTHLLGAHSCSFAHAINGKRVVGFGRGAGTQHADHALLWTGPNSTDVIDLHQFAPAGSRSSRAYSVDAKGNIVGWIDGQAALWQLV